MPAYQFIDAAIPAGKRTIERILALRKKIKAEIPEKKLNETLLLATWNIREFDSPAYGKRMTEALYYIAEILSAFDLIAVQEIRDDLTALNDVMKILGDNWDYMFSDVTEGSQGNNERTAFIYDTRKVNPAGLVGEIVFPPIEKKITDNNNKKVTVYEPVLQSARTPFLVGFTAGWADFVLTTVHMIWGNDIANDPQRVKEIDTIATILKEKSTKAYEWSRNFILLGDFNIFSSNDDTFKALTKNGFDVPPELIGTKSNANKDREYDQIAFHDRANKFETTGKAGVFDFYDTVYTLNDESIYKTDMGPAYDTTEDGKPRKNKSAYYKTYWRTYQMSDHLPKWIELKIDFTEAFLNRKLSGG
ncbi:MAG: endonuclease/exonuclease/phosphatase family protein [Chitinophagaceae bacterium]